MYANGEGVQRDELKAYRNFNQLVESYDEDQPERQDVSAISDAFVAVGVYCLNGIPNSDVLPDPSARAHCSNTRRRLSPIQTRNTISLTCT